MIRKKLALPLLISGLILSSNSLYAACTDDEKIELTLQGMSEADLVKKCDNKSSTPASKPTPPPPAPTPAVDPIEQDLMKVEEESQQKLEEKRRSAEEKKRIEEERKQIEAEKRKAPPPPQPTYQQNNYYEAPRSERSESEQESNRSKKDESFLFGFLGFGTSNFIKKDDLRQGGNGIKGTDTAGTMVPFLVEYYSYWIGISYSPVWSIRVRDYKNGNTNISETLLVMHNFFNVHITTDRSYFVKLGLAHGAGFSSYVFNRTASTSDGFPLSDESKNFSGSSALTNLYIDIGNDFGVRLGRQQMSTYFSKSGGMRPDASADLNYLMLFFEFN